MNDIFGIRFARAGAMGRLLTLLLAAFFVGALTTGCESITTGKPPAININNPSIVFFQANEPENVRVRNVGDGPLTILSVRLAGAGASHFEITRDFDTEVEPGGSTDFQAEWLGTGGAPTARIEITSNDPRTRQVTVDLRVAGGAPRVAIANEPVRFGLVPAGISNENAPRRETSLRNVGNATLEISELYIEQTGSDILFDGDPNALLPLTLEAFTDELPLTFVCQPETDLQVDAQLIVYSNDSSGAAVPGSADLYEHSFLIQCNSAAPCLDVRTDGVSRDEATPIDFGSTPFGRARTKQVYVSNCDPRGGDDPLIVSQIYIPDEHSSEYYEVDLSNIELPIELGYGEETYFNLMYAPEDTGAEDFITDHTALRFLSNDEAREEFDVPVEGYGSDFEPPIADIKCRVPAGQSAPQTGWLTSLETQPFVRVTCSGEDSEDPNGLAISDYIWTVDTPDQGGLQQPDTGVETSILLNTVGTFRVTLVARNTQGMESDPVSATITAVPRGELLFRLKWDHWFGGRTDANNPQTGGCGADVDLHVIPNRGVWYGNPSMFWQTRTQTWSGATATLDMDVIRGIGPENVTIENPVANETYRAAAHVYNDAGFGTAEATMEVIVGGHVMGRYRRGLEATNHWWDAAAVVWDAAAPDVIEVDNYYPSMCASPYAPSNCRDRGSTSNLPQCW